MSPFLSKITLSKKIAIIVLSLVLPLVFLLYLFLNNTFKNIETAYQEKKGIEFLNQAATLLQMTQQHRGLSTIFLNGNESFRQKMVDKQSEIAFVLSGLKQINEKYFIDEVTSKALQNVEKKWNKIKASVPHTTPDENVYAHSVLNNYEILPFLETIGRVYNFDLDPALNNYFTILTSDLPVLTEALGRMRANGLAVMGKGDIVKEEDKIHLVMLLDLAKISETRVIDGLQSLRELADVIQYALEKTDEFFYVYDKLFISGTKRTTPQNEYIVLATETIDSVFSVENAAFRIIGQLLNTRIDNLIWESILKIVVTLTIIILVIIFSILVVRNIVRRLNSIIDISKHVAEGDLTLHVIGDRGTDEISVLMNHIKSMTENQRKVMRELITVANVIISAVRKNLLSISNMNASSTQTTSSIAETAVSMNLIKQSADACQKKAEGVLKSAEGISNSLQLGKQLTDSTIEEMGHIRDQVSSISKNMESLIKISHEIRSIIKVVESLADQSNLLSLNASIEAELAGHYGRAFAVVAQEVRNLAKRSRYATEDVKNSLDSIATAIKNVSIAVHQGNQVVEIGVQQAINSGESFLEVSNTINTTMTFAKEIALANEEQFLSLDQVAVALKNIKEASAFDAANLKILQIEVSKMDAVGLNLKELIDKYKVDVGEKVLVTHHDSDLRY